jgi:hypothetical protein
VRIGRWVERNGWVGWWVVVVDLGCSFYIKIDGRSQRLNCFSKQSRLDLCLCLRLRLCLYFHFNLDIWLAIMEPILELFICSPDLFLVPVTQLLLGRRDCAISSSLSLNCLCLLKHLFWTTHAFVEPHSFVGVPFVISVR